VQGSLTADLLPRSASSGEDGDEQGEATAAVAADGRRTTAVAARREVKLALPRLPYELLVKRRTTES
jgi:hypothetical protein